MRNTLTSTLRRRQRFGVRALIMATTLTVALALVAGLSTYRSGSAHAATGYSVSAGMWNVRSCPQPSSCGAEELIGSGPLASVVCQMPGATSTVAGFGTSSVWDLVKTPAGRLGYISDLAVAQTLYAQFDPRLPRCDSPSSPGAGAAESSSYTWLFSCAGKVFSGKRWACWTAAGKYLFTPLPAS